MRPALTTNRNATDTSTTRTPRSLVSLLGEQRAAIVERLRGGSATVAALADHLGISEVATRRHLGVLEQDGLVAARTTPTTAPGRGRGRPPVSYTLTDEAGRLFPQGYDRFASEVLNFLADTHGRDGLKAFLRWRLKREVGELQQAVTAQDLHERLEQLAEALSEAGFRASVNGEGDEFTLTQDHCAIFDVAKDHPEVCAYEAATFSQVLGSDVTLSRRETLAGGYRACVCCVTPKDAAAERRRTTQATGPSTSHDAGRGDKL